MFYQATATKLSPANTAGDAVEALLTSVERRRLAFSTTVDPERRARLGQFMTPRAVAQLMAEMLPLPSGEVRLLDPGAGLGSLTAAYVARAVSAEVPPQVLSITAFEVDAELRAGLGETLAECAELCNSVGIRFGVAIAQEDFIAAAVSAATTSSLPPHSFTGVLMNPPYGKIGVTSEARRLVRELGVDVTNLYAAFVVCAISLLQPGGGFVAITPRSFCNGTYFRAYRRFLLRELSLRRLHLFESRSAAFRVDAVLQENLILSGDRSNDAMRSVVLSWSDGPETAIRSRRVSYSRVVESNDRELFIRIPGVGRSNDERIRVFKTRISDLEVQVSTGPVVDFRNRPHLVDGAAAGAVPLIYPQHFAQGQIVWPGVRRAKPDAIHVNDATRDLLVPNGPYVLIRRFSAKEETRRVFVVVYEGQLPFDSVAFENHLNFIHASRRPLDRDLAWGLAMFLNSSLVDAHFREFSGHTQVNAGDIRALPMPDRDQLRRLGAGAEKMPSQAEIDAAVAELVAEATVQQTTLLPHD